MSEKRSQSQRMPMGLSSIQPQHGPERQFAHHGPHFVADDEAFAVDRFTQSDLLRQDFPRGIDGFLVGNLYRREFGANPVFVQHTVSSDMEIELWHSGTVVFSGPNPSGGTTFQIAGLAHIEGYPK